MNNLNVRRWSPQPDGSFKVKVFECGTLSKFDTEEPLDEWDNPITGERIKGHHFRGGPLSLTVTKDGSLSTGAEATVKPEPLNFQFIDDSIYMLQASAFSYPNPFQPDEWPKESSGAKAYWDSHYIYMAKINDLVDPDTTQAPSYIQLQNMTSWWPWLRMGQIPGRSWGRGFGKKSPASTTYRRSPGPTLNAVTPKSSISPPGPNWLTNGAITNGKIHLISQDCPIFAPYQCASTCSTVHLGLWAPIRILLISICYRLYFAFGRQGPEVEILSPRPPLLTGFRARTRIGKAGYPSLISPPAGF